MLTDHSYIAHDNPSKLIIINHGYGDTGAGLMALAPYIEKALPEALAAQIAFYAPDAPYPCEMGMGRQWFSLQGTRNPDGSLCEAQESLAIYEQGAKEAAPFLQNYIRFKCAHHKVVIKDCILIGFSQGTMMTLYAGLSDKERHAALIGFSGGLYAGDDFDMKYRPPVCLIHGENDPVVPVNASRTTATYLKDKGVDPALHILPDLDHSIDPRGIAIAASFIGNVLSN